MKKLFAIICTILAVHTFNENTALAFGNMGRSGMPGQESGQEAEMSEEEIARIKQAKKQGMEEAKKVVVAKVNGVPITMYSVVQMMNRIGRQTVQQGAPTPEEIEKVKQTAVERLIFQELAYQKAKETGLKADPQNIDNALSNLMENLGDNEDAYKKFLEDEMLTEDELKAAIEKSLVLQLIFAKEVVEKAKVSDEMIREEYNKEKSRFLLPEKMQVIDVLFIEKKDEMKNAKRILQMIKADKDKDPWNLVLDGTFIVRHYDIKKDRDQLLYEAAKKVKPGSLSGIIKANDGLHIIKMVKHEPERYATLDEARGYFEKKLIVEAQAKRLQEWETEMRKEAKIDILESENKDDSGKKPEEKKQD